MRISGETEDGRRKTEDGRRKTEDGRREMSQFPSAFDPPERGERGSVLQEGVGKGWLFGLIHSLKAIQTALAVIVQESDTLPLSR